MKSLLPLLLSLTLFAPIKLVHAEETLRLIFVGDIMLDDGPGKSIAAGKDPFAQFDAVLKAADYRIGNLECPIATQGEAMASKIFTFRAHPRVLPLLKTRFDALSVANNHAGDYGKAAFLETLDQLATVGIHHFGGGRNLREAHQAHWINAKGLRVAVLGYNEFKPRAFEAGPDWPGLAWSEDTQVIADIRAARKAGADLIIPFLHWGWEREPNPSARQRRLARRMIDAGADIVVGAHPHITQGAEYYKGKPIIYSLGNFVFDSFTEPALRRGWLLRLELNKRGVLAWNTLAADMDDDGTPQRVPGAFTPCGNARQKRVEQCKNE